jgi:hypothetical protein
MAEAGLGGVFLPVQRVFETASAACLIAAFSDFLIFGRFLLWFEG